MNTICIGCGCDEQHACESPNGGPPCHWLAAEDGRGVCSSCPSELARWERGDDWLSPGAIQARDAKGIEPERCEHGVRFDQECWRCDREMIGLLDGEPPRERELLLPDDPEFDATLSAVLRR